MKLTTMNRRTLALAALVSVTAFAVWAYSNRAPSSESRAIAQTSGLTTTVGGAPNNGRVAAGTALPTGATTATRPSEELLRRYNSGDNIRAFVAYALAHPQEGGALYASHLLTQCRGISIGTEFLESAQLQYAGQPDYAERSEAAARLNRRCEGLLPEELGIGRDREILSQGESQGDPLLTAERNYSAATQGFKDSAAESEARRTAMGQVLATQDALLIENLGMRLSIYVDGATGRKYFWFAGKSYALDSDVDVGGALYLLPCGLGMACDKTEFTTAMRCASGEGCDASRFDYLRRTYETRPGVYDKVLALQAAMVEAVKTGNVSAFVR